MDRRFAAGDTAYVHRNVVVDRDGREVLAGTDAGEATDDADTGWKRVLQEVTVRRVDGHRAVVAHSGETHRYHVDKLRADPSGPDELKPQAWNP